MKMGMVWSKIMQKHMNVTVIPAEQIFILQDINCLELAEQSRISEGAIAGLTKKAESMSGGNRTETKTARMMLAELYYTGSCSETLYDGTVVTATIDKLDKETALCYLKYHQEEYSLSDADIQAIVSGFDIKVTEKEIEALKNEIAELKKTVNDQSSKLQTADQNTAANPEKNSRT